MTLSHYPPYGNEGWSRRTLDTVENIAANLERISDEMLQVCHRAGRDPAGVALMAVSKVHPVDYMIAALKAGQRLFGESRVREWEDKAPEVRRAGKPEVHLIGPLQSNKTTRAARLFDAIDTVDSFKTVRRIDNALADAGATRRFNLLIEVKLSPEDSKHGADPSALAALLEQVSTLTRVQVCGLMTVPPWSDDPELARPYFRQLRALRDSLGSRGASLTELSMGMSNDFRVAIEEGSTCVRIGTASFGRRPPTTPSAT